MNWLTIQAVNFYVLFENTMLMKKVNGVAFTKVMTLNVSFNLNEKCMHRKKDLSKQSKICSLLIVVSPG